MLEKKYSLYFLSKIFLHRPINILFFNDRRAEVRTEDFLFLYLWVCDQIIHYRLVIIKDLSKLRNNICNVEIDSSKLKDI